MTGDNFDVIVLGSGAAGLTAALTAAAAGSRVLVCEKAAQVGGTSAWSGGAVWVPNNPHMVGVGAFDSEEEGVAYLLSLSRDLMDQALVRAFVRAGPEMVRFVDEHARMGFSALAGFPDYYSERPGGKPGGGRTLEAAPFSFHELGSWASRVTPSPYYAGTVLRYSETPTGAAVPTVVAAEEVERRRTNDERGLGQALIGRLLHGCLAAGVSILTEAAGIELIQRDDDTVVGVQVSKGGEVAEYRCSAIILATGGFEWNRDYCRAFLRGPLSHPVSIETSEGDGLRMAMRAGAALGNMREAWWTTVAEIPSGNQAGQKVMLSAERSRPRSIMVNRHGQRFTNESLNYNAFGSAFHQEDPVAFEYRNLPCWLIFDQVYLERYGTLKQPPGATAPDWMIRADTLGGLAEVLGIPAPELVETVRRWNELVGIGRDIDFRRGDFIHDRWWGDPAFKGSIQGVLGPIDSPPYYAVEVFSGALGTKGGPVIDSHARVIDLNGNPIPGLYAAGNVMASPYGMTYGGAGGTLGPAMTAGYLAGAHASSGLPAR